MKLRHPWLIRLAALVGALAIRMWMRTVRYEIRWSEASVHPDDPSSNGYFIYGLWHESLLAPAGRRWKGKFRVLISQHADGELIAQVCKRLGFATVRGSSTRGGAKALRELMRQGQCSHLMVTPDGPRGPRRKVQAGIVYAASRTGLPVVPVGVGFQNAWRAGSWDRFAVPKPGSRVCAVVGEPIPIPAAVELEALEEYRVQVEQAMLAATAAAEAMAHGKMGDRAWLVSPRAAA